MFEVRFFDRFQPIVCIINRNGQILEFGKVFFDLSMVSLGHVDFAPFEAQIHLVTSIFLDYNCNSEWTRFTRVGFKWVISAWVTRADMELRTTSQGFPFCPRAR